MSEAGSYSPASRKRPLIADSSSPAAASCGGDAAGVGSGSPRAKRRLFAAGSGGALPAAWPGRRATAAAAEMDQIKLARRRLIIQGAALSVVAASVCFLQVMSKRRGREYSAQHLTPLRAALAELTSAIRAATAPPEPHPDLYPTVMGTPGLTREELLVALSYLVDGKGRGAAFLVMSEPHRALCIKHILAKQEI